MGIWIVLAFVWGGLIFYLIMLKRYFYKQSQGLLKKMLVELCHILYGSGYGDYLKGNSQKAFNKDRSLLEKLNEKDKVMVSCYTRAYKMGYRDAMRGRSQKRERVKKIKKEMTDLLEGVKVKSHETFELVNDLLQQGL